MALQTRDSDSVAAVLRDVMQKATEKTPQLDAKAECHKHAASLGIILVEEPLAHEDETRRHRAHPMG